MTARGDIQLISCARLAPATSRVADERRRDHRQVVPAEPQFAMYTGHGITVPPNLKRFDIADRANSEIDRFSPDGKYLSTLNMPEESFPCDVYYLGKYMAVASLNNPDKTKGAVIYILENDQLASTILPKEELGLTNFMHIHNAVLRQVGKKYYVIAQAWNPGDFAILEQVL